jgi:hypothetical protein
MATAQTNTPKPSRWRRRFVWLVGLLAALALMTLSTSPSVPKTPPPTSSQVRTAKRAFDRLRVLADSGKPGDVALSWDEASQALALAGQASNVPHITLEGAAAQATIRASVPVIVGLWLNIETHAAPNDAGFPILSAKIGRLPIPAFLTRGVMDFGRWILSLRGVDVPAFDAVVQSVAFAETGMVARVTVPRNSKLYATLNKVKLNPIDTKATVATYCRLAKMQRADPSTDFALQVRRAFAGGEQSLEDNRAALVALAMFTVAPDVGKLAGDTLTLAKPCLMAPQGLRLLGRTDLSKHWAMSAAMTAAYGAGLSQAMGTWKEVSDSGPRGSGFSFIDVAADRSGIRAGTQVSSPETAAAAALRLRSITEQALLPIKALALEEGMTEAEFASQFANVESDAYARTLARIDKVLAR